MLWGPTAARTGVGHDAKHQLGVVLPAAREENELSWQRGLLLSAWEEAFSFTWLGQAALLGTGARGGTCKEPTPRGSSTSTGRELSSRS